MFSKLIYAILVSSGNRQKADRFPDRSYKYTSSPGEIAPPVFEQTFFQQLQK
jgi:hypothetical protein